MLGRLPNKRPVKKTTNVYVAVIGGGIVIILLFMLLFKLIFLY